MPKSIIIEPEKVFATETIRFLRYPGECLPENAWRKNWRFFPARTS